MNLTTLQEQGLQPDVIEEVTENDGSTTIYMTYFERGKFPEGGYNKCMIKRITVIETSIAGKPVKQTAIMYPNGQADHRFDFGWRFQYDYQYKDNFQPGFNPEA